MSGTKGRSGGAREGSGPKPKPKSDVVDAFSLKPRGHPVGVPAVGMMVVSPVQSTNNRTQLVSYLWQRNGISPRRQQHPTLVLA